MVLSTGSVVRRMRLATGEEHEQLKWFAYAAALAVVTLTASFFPNMSRIEARWADTIEVLAILSIGAVVVAVGVAILKYRLYDIDLIINRTLVYVPLTAIIAGTYIAAITLFKSLFLSITGQTSDAAVVLTTLAVASAFTPLKNWLQTIADRYFKEPADPIREASRFRDQVRSVVEVMDARRLTSRLLDEAVRAFDAVRGAVYLGNENQLQLRHVHGEWHHQTATNATMLSVPLESDGLQIGLLALGERRNGHAYSARDSDALKSMADVVAQAVALGDRGGIVLDYRRPNPTE
jgi:hypothetical protein